MEMPKVCMFVWNHFTNDARVLRECTALAEAGYEVDLVAIHDIKDEKNKKHEVRNGFSITRVNRYPASLLFIRKYFGAIKRRRYLFYLLVMTVGIGLFIYNPLLAIITAALAALLKIIKFPRLWINGYVILNMISCGMKKDYDIYHSNDLNTLPQGWICSKLLRLKKKKLIYDSHEVQTSRTGYGKNIYYVEKFFINRVDAIINTNRTRAEYTAKLYNIKLPYIVHNYPFYYEESELSNKVDLHSIVGIDKSEPILLYQGGIQVGRGLEKIIEAAPLFDKGIVVFVGDGRQKPQLQRMVKEKKLESKIKFIPKVPVDQLPYYTANGYLGFQVLNNVCFNHYSACSNKLYEYIMAEIPVVACSFPEIKRVVEDSKIGICVDSHSPEDIARGVNYLLNNKEQTRQMSKNCIDARKRYNWDLEKGKLIKAYDRCLN